MAEQKTSYNSAFSVIEEFSSIVIGQFSNPHIWLEVMSNNIIILYGILNQLNFYIENNRIKNNSNYIFRYLIIFCATRKILLL